MGQLIIKFKTIKKQKPSLEIIPELKKTLKPKNKNVEKSHFRVRTTV